jgi:hypothetical protein
MAPRPPPAPPPPAADTGRFPTAAELFLSLGGDHASGEDVLTRAWLSKKNEAAALGL